MPPGNGRAAQGAGAIALLVSVPRPPYLRGLRRRDRAAPGDIDDQVEGVMPTFAQARAHMEKSLDAMRREFNSVRTGKASPALLDMVKVDAYGSKMPLNQVASVSSPEPRMLLVQPWDKGLMGEIEKAIRNAELGLNPANDGNIIRVPIPALNEERRRELVRMLHKQGEEGRIAIRHARQEANKEIKRRQSDNELSEDDAHREMDRIQKLTDEYIGKVDHLLSAKEEEVMEV
jgi:ribosome recycling factor